MRSLRLIAILAVAIVATRVQQQTDAGVIADKGDAFWWVSNHTAGAPNNDDFVGEFAGNPNKVNVNSVNQSAQNRLRQRINEIERLVPTASSNGVTEYALTLGANQPPSAEDDVFLFLLDNRFVLELGFGKGANFVPARQVAPQLQFDSTAMVSPAIQNYKPIPIATLPLLELLEHRGDSLLFQGRYDLGNFRIGSFATGSLVVLPTDIPDLPLSARAFYSAAQLAGLSDSEVPFTIRMQIVPEPAGATLAIIELAGAVLGARRCRHRTPPQITAGERLPVN